MSGGGDMQCVSIVREEEGEWRGRQCEYSEGGG